MKVQNKTIPSAIFETNETFYKNNMDTLKPYVAPKKKVTKVTKKVTKE